MWFGKTLHGEMTELGFDVTAFLTDVPLFIITVIVLSRFFLADYSFDD